MVIFTARQNLANLNEVKMNLIVKFANLAGKSYIKYRCNTISIFTPNMLLCMARYVKLYHESSRACYNVKYSTCTQKYFCNVKGTQFRSPLHQLSKKKVHQVME